MAQRIRLKTFGVAVWTFVGLTAVCCQTQPARADEPDSAAIEFFEKHVRPLLIKHCYECHTTREPKGGLALDTRAGVLKGGDSGPAIVPSESEKSRLIDAVRYQNSDLQMPPKGRIPATDIEILEKWVAMGAPDPRTELVEGGGAPGPTGMSIEDGRQFWSFRPVVKPIAPEVRDHAWVKTPVDAFVLAQLEAKGLKPAPPADKRTLIRRVTFDLIGLPPTPEDVDAFLADESSTAFTTVVERLLKSPGYGVRWGRHWLDVARYADSNGLDENLAFGNAWRYRDYVVNAFNQNKPFDRFLIEQLAGDLLSDANQESQTATGFLVLGAKVLAEPDRNKLEMDTIDEQLDTTGKAFLGMTLGCVRCHDHKFDPVKQSEYYGLAAIFKSTRTFADSNTGAIKHWNEYSFATETELASLKEVDKQIADKKAVASAYKNAAMSRLRDEIRAKATDYLVAAAGFEPSMSLSQVASIAAPRGLHPRTLHHCRLHLSYRRDDDVLGKWHEFVAEGNLAGIAEHFRPLFAEAEAALATAREADPKAAKLSDSRLERVREVLYDPSGFLAVPPKPEFAFDEQTLREYHRLSEEARIVESNAPDAASAMGVSDGTVAVSLPIHIRGSHQNLGTSVPRDVPHVMLPEGRPFVVPTERSGRLELAQWMASGQHPLTARVYVNRIWRWHFGAGLVASTENFGKLGDRPTHPELLDWLASTFVEGGWSTQDMHRLILSSNTYLMSSSHPDEANASQVDPEDHLYWKFRLQRLDAEQIRDAVLKVSGRLDESVGGKSVPLRNRQFVFDHTSIDHTKYDSLRRALYLPVIRNNLYSLFEQFDFPDPTMPTGSRNSTTVAPQALIMMNSELVMDSAAEFARQLLEQPIDDAARVRRGYERALSRVPTDTETNRVLAFVTNLSNQPVSSATSDKDSPPVDARQRAWTLFCQSLFASNEFLFVR
ncbi:PSD1 and planctomycete cytochrome C domain-containing protein [Schlesneria paludicola]|uniref:PSD1 and planctomycete cytochrome C domain-containing protein n=1 Tax=Schlesneria paludicola TaxID=360056 RepID=UPI00029B0013|nr:PSD1 and planctomycete cytochrome C domain-containing protein [Schlesneria paludicola]